MSRFQGKVAVITGAARGIGFGVATRLAEEGASIAILDLNAADAEAAAAKLPLQEDARAIGIAADVTDSDSVTAAVDRVAEEFGLIHILMNNAGVTKDNLLFKLPENEWDLVINTHLKGHFLMTKAVQKYFVDQNYGKIVNVSSVSALGLRGQANYATAKAGVQGFTRTVALELGRYNVNVNAIAPGFVVTDMTDATAARLRMTPEEFREAAAQEVPLKRVGYPSDIAALVAFLASDEASYITGQIVYTDGGESLPG